MNGYTCEFDHFSSHDGAFIEIQDWLSHDFVAAKPSRYLELIYSTSIFIENAIPFKPVYHFDRIAWEGDGPVWNT